MAHYEIPGPQERKVWFITGASRGFGRALTEAALEAGEVVVATARRPEQLDGLVSKYGGHVLPLRLDVTDPSLIRLALSEAHDRFGRVDVLVNNAGYANVSPIEFTDDANFREQFETNFWGVYNVTKAAIPLLRAQRSGLVMQFSSLGGRVGGSPGLGSYQAAKFAIDGFSRVVQAELAPFGVRVLVVEPSGFRTDWAGASMTVANVAGPYESTVGLQNSRMRQNSDGPAGDPARAAKILVHVARRRDIPYHLPLGALASEWSIAQDRRLLEEDEKWREVSRSADFAQPFPADFPPDSPQDN